MKCEDKVKRHEGWQELSAEGDTVNNIKSTSKSFLFTQTL